MPYPYTFNPNTVVDYWAALADKNGEPTIYNLPAMELRPWLPISGQEHWPFPRAMIRRYLIQGTLNEVRGRRQLEASFSCIRPSGAVATEMMGVVDRQIFHNGPDPYCALLMCSPLNLLEDRAEDLDPGEDQIFNNHHFMIGDIKFSARYPDFDNGWRHCDGGEMSRVDFPELFYAIGTVYGSGNGTTTFNVPDMRGRIAVKVGSANGLNSLGIASGSQTKTIAGYNLPIHYPQFNYSSVDGTQGTVRLGGTSEGVLTGNQLGQGTPIDIMPPYLVLDAFILAYHSYSNHHVGGG